LVSKRVANAIPRRADLLTSIDISWNGFWEPGVSLIETALRGGAVILLGLIAA
jgi:hypothetical protein